MFLKRTHLSDHNPVRRSCMHRASSHNMYIKQQDAQNLAIRLYFPLDALHVSDYISSSSGATSISCTSHLVYAGICRYYTSGIGIYQMRCTAYKSRS